MAKKPVKTDQKASPDWVKWSHRIAAAERQWKEFCTQGTEIIDRYRLEKNRIANAASKNFARDKYNILYSSTETMRPSLYAMTPKPQVNPRHKDNTDQKINAATMVLENCLQYALEDIGMDDVMSNVVGDYLLPGLGVAWVRYEAETAEVDLNEDVEGAEPDMYEYTEWEALSLDYVHFKDFLCSGGRTWDDVWWVARRSYMFKEDAVKRFGDVAKKLDYSHQQEEKTSTSGKNHRLADSDQAIVWEIWDKRTKTVIWWSEGLKEILDERPDPLKIKSFFPCPRPLRAVTSTDCFTPRSFFTQYREQAEALDDLTMRIRILSKALRLVGVYDQSQAALQRLLTGMDNKMVGVENFAQFSSTGGLQGSVQFLPIKDVAQVLTELYRQRDIAKNEIYEITGFSDITRGVSKASETLGAQEIKNQWAGGRLKMLQKEVQRFCRDIIRIMAEVIAEQFDEETLQTYSGYQRPELTPQEQQMQQQAVMAAMSGQPAPQMPPTAQQQYDQMFAEVIQLLRVDRSRCAVVSIETDSTIQPDEAEEREARMAFLSGMGAFLQQAGPMAMQYPDMRGLLGAMMMFTARTFRASRPIEKEFEEFTKKLQAQPPMDPNGNKEGGDDGKAKADAALQTTQMKEQGAMQREQMKVQADTQTTQAELASKERIEMAKVQQQGQFKARELALREREVAVREAELGLKRTDMQHEHRMDEEDAAREDERLDLDADAQRTAARQADEANRQQVGQNQD